MVGDTKKIKGKTYSFDDKGVMYYGWSNDATIAGVPSTAAYFADADNGSLQKDRWVWSDGTDGLTGDQQVIGHNDDDHWYYVRKNGLPYRDMAKKINGKWYIFDEEGQMQWGLVWTSEESIKNCKEGGKVVVRQSDPEEINGDDIVSGKGEWLHFFSTDEEKDGSMKTGTNIKIELMDDTYTFGFDKNTGAAYQGVEKNKLYDQGILKTADDNKYEVKSIGSANYLVSANGTRMKATTRTYKDADDVYWFVESGNDKDGYKLFYSEESAKAAKDPETRKAY
jgi:hypothetical protein